MITNRGAQTAVLGVMAAILKGCDQITTQIAISSGTSAEVYSDKSIVQKAQDLLSLINSDR